MTARDAAVTIRTSASRRLGLAVIAAGGLLAASTHAARAQLCTCAEPGWMNCSLMGFSSHEPATAAFPECMARGSYGGGGEPSAGESPRRQEFRGATGRRPQSHVVRGAVIRPPPPRPPVAQPLAVPNPPVVPLAAPAAAALGGLRPSGFNPTTGGQIHPLNCPRGFSAIGQTFYGGTRCGPAAPPAAAGAPAAVAAAVDAAAAALDDADDEPASADNPPNPGGANPPSTQNPPPAPPPASPASPLAEPPPPSQAAAENALNTDLAKGNWSAAWPVAASAGLVVGIPAGVAAFAIRRYGLALIPW